MKREEAIQWLKTVEVLGFDEKADWIQDALDMAIEALEENESLAKSLNDATELIHKLQKKDDGKWIEIDFRDGTMYGFHQCSVCGARYHCKFDTPPDWNYCPNCGAQMEKESRNERQNADNI